MNKPTCTHREIAMPRPTLYVSAMLAATLEQYSNDNAEPLCCSIDYQLNYTLIHISKLCVLYSLS